MRLTLRTLLAYLDDRLPPEKAREIGLKIQKSPFATELAERVREVKRRRRVAADQDKVPSVDANLIAEYLDDQLAPDVVARLEQRILASDALLAEVAAAHELLGLLREPVTVDARLRERLLTLDQTGSSAAPVSAGAGREPSDAAAEGWVNSPASSTGWLRWSSLLVGVGVCAWLISLFTDPRLLKPPAAVTADAGTGEPVVAPAEPAVEIGADVAGAPAGAGAEEPAGQIASTDSPVEAENPSAASQPAAMAETGPAAVQPDPVNVPPAEPVAALDPAAADAPVPPAVEYTVLLQADNRTVLLANEKTGTWKTLLQVPGGETISATPNITNSAPFLKHSWFGVPQPFDMKLRYEEGGWLIRALGGSLLRLPADQPGIQALAGRMVLTADTAVAWQEEQLPQLPLLCGQSLSLLTLATAETRIALQIVPRSVVAEDVLTESTVTGVAAAEPSALLSALLSAKCDYDVQVTVLQGTAMLQVAGGELQMLPAGVQAEWQVVDGGETSGFRQIPSTPATIPVWMLAPETEPVPEAASVRTQLTKSLEAGGDPREAILPLVADRNPEVGLLATEVLVLTRSVDSLLNLFFEDLDEVVQRRIIDGLQAIAGSSETARELIRESLSTRLPMAEAININSLLNGVNAVRVAEPETAQQLLAYLGDERLGVRTLAIYRLEQITGDRQNFYPANDASRRRDAIRRWQKWLDRQGGVLVKPVE